MMQPQNVSNAAIVTALAMGLVVVMGTLFISKPVCSKPSPLPLQQLVDTIPIDEGAALPKLQRQFHDADLYCLGPHSLEIVAKIRRGGRGIQVMNPLGYGSYGSVYSGTFGKVNVAIKVTDLVINSSPSPRLAKSLDMFIVGHIGIIITPLYAGGTLEDDRVPATFSVEEHLRVRAEPINGIALALVDLGQLDLVHMDVKTANVFLREDGALVLGDYCLTSVSGVEYGPLPNTGVSADEMTYTAPWPFNRHIKACDIFSLGRLIETFMDISFIRQRNNELAKVLNDLQSSCMHPIPFLRPTAMKVVSILHRALKAKK